ncbi:hypothetical protein [Coleofasciculus chthonoplastes]|uniref:hypothetical protein n=1 Tax=Coleofasciculus chthonoplastes TaxID=64178 RepID=UPI001E4FE1E5|nr:hypothetical protein [Coleofasciculus chthonoplastes]
MPTLGMVLFIPGIFGPGIAAISVVRYASGQNGLHSWLWRSLQWRLGWRWLALSFFLPLAVMALAAAVHIALGIPSDDKELPRNHYQSESSPTDRPVNRHSWSVLQSNFSVC